MKSKLAKAVKCRKRDGKGGPGEVSGILSQLQAMQPGDLDPAMLDQIMAEIDRLKAPPMPEAPMAPPMGAPVGGPPPMGGMPGLPV